MVCKPETIFLYIAYEIEGMGYDKKDPAGKTIFGITEKYYPEYYNEILEVVHNQEKLNKKIIEVYTKLYHSYMPYNLKYPLDIFFFDFSFNSKPKEAIRVLQRALNNLTGSELEPDGKWGNLTEGVYNKFKDNIFLPEMFEIERKKWYIRNPQKRYRCGWINRCLKLEQFIIKCSALKSIFEVGIGVNK